MNGETGAPPRLVFVTGHQFGCNALEGLMSSPAFLAGRVSVPLVVGLDPAHARATVGYRSPAALAQEIGAQFLATADGTLVDIVARLRAVRPQYILIIGWSRLVPASILRLPEAVGGAGGSAPGSSGCIGMHPTRLPEGRGRAPIPWTVLKGLRDTALSVFFLSEQADAGPLIRQYELSVSPFETATSLFRRFANLHFNAGLELAGSLAAGPVPSLEQSGDGVSVWPKRTPESGRLVGDLSMAEATALVRAQTPPYPPATVWHRGEWRAIASAHGLGHGSAPGQPEPEVVTFSCRDGELLLRLAVPAGARV